ncbi:MAG: 3-oxoacyl-ACP synthase [Oscillospiraceae bacterium]|nr:3-oxoacyl-ACP synthase [Oscillospiraceae bacterium]
MTYTILGTGSALPSRAVSNEELTRFLDTSDEWIASRTGIRSRRILTRGTLAQLGALAARRALEDSGTAVEELDLILCSTARGDHVTPALACGIQQELGATCPAYDISAACAAFIYVMDCALGYFARGKVKRVLIIAAEEMSRFVDWTDRSTCVLFGDAAGAVVLGPGDDCLSTVLTTRGNVSVLNLPHIQGNCPFQTQSEAKLALYMDGQEVFKFAVNAVIQNLHDALAEAQVGMDDIAYFTLHQANMRILNYALKKLELAEGRMPSIMAETGNISSASIPVIWDKLSREGILKPGQLIAAAGFGAGLVSGAGVFRWSRARTVPEAWNPCCDL